MSKIFLKGGFVPSAHNLYAIEINFLFFLIFFHTLLASLEIGDHLREKSAKMKADHDKQAGAELPVLYEGQKVRVKDQNDHTWQPATVSKICDEPRSYEITTPNGATYRRNRSQIREINSKPQPRRVRFADEVEQQNTQKQTQHKPDPAHDKSQTEQTSTKDQQSTKGPSPATTTRSGRVSRKPHRFRDEY